MKWLIDQTVHMTPDQGIALGLFLIATAIMIMTAVQLRVDERRNIADQERQDRTEAGDVR